MKNAKFLIIFGDKNITEFMQVCDMFDKAKVHGVVNEMTVSYAKSEKMSFKRCGTLVHVLKDALEVHGRVLTFVHLMNIEDDDAIHKNNGKVNPYVNLDVREVSDGKRSFLLADFLRLIGFDVETDKNMFVKKVTI